MQPLQEAFVAFASFGSSSPQREIDSAKFSKLCKVSGRPARLLSDSLRTLARGQCPPLDFRSQSANPSCLTGFSVQ